MYRFGKGFTLQVKIGSPDDFIGAVSEPIQLRGRQSSRFGSRRGSRFGSSLQRSSTPESPKSPPMSPEPTHGDQDLPVNNFHRFIQETFENSTLIEEHQVIR